MKIRERNTYKTALWLTILAIAGMSFTGCKEKAQVTTNATEQIVFTTPTEAGEALQAAYRAYDEGALHMILGEGSAAILNSGDPAEDKAAIAAFTKKYDRMNRWVTLTDGSEILYIGADNYPFPIPLAKNDSGKWYFDTAAGEDEMLARRIGRNELLAIEAAEAIAKAHQHHAKSEPMSSLSGIVPGGNSTQPPILDGYTFRILSSPATPAPSGDESHATSGPGSTFAVIASPTKYADSGIMTFILNGDGVVYQKDLGQKTAEVAASIKQYNPIDGWTPAE